MMYLPPKTSPSCAIGICGRCAKKMYLNELKSDPNVPGLRVCKDCADVFDPERLPPRDVENIAVNHPRTDEDLV